MSNGLAIFSYWKALARLPTSSRSSSSECRPPLAASPPALIRPASLHHSPKLQHSPSRIEIKSVEPTTATDILRLMDSLQLPISADMYATLLKECIESGDVTQGGKVHSHMIHHIDLRMDLLMVNRLLLMYASCSQLDTACILFDGMPMRDSISWGTMIAGHEENGDSQNVLRLFAQMRENGLDPTAPLLVCVLKACVGSGDLGLGEQVHSWFIKKKTMLRNREDIPVVASLINLYSGFGCLESARRVFDEMGRHCDGTVVWTILMDGYCKEGSFEEVLNFFKEMGRAGRKKKCFTFPTVLRACGRLGDDGQVGRQVHAAAIKVGVESDMFVQSSLVDMYGKCGLLNDARKALEMTAAVSSFDKKNTNDNNIVVCWNAMLHAYASHGLCTEAIKLLYEMKAAGIEPQESMLYQARIACGS
eukprot:TRINITY_DN8384_c0_g1_i1.p1 TRINITY_DN8384_c0_g1~~TRINITY_DN8384_c0_g1_i1.p1  ORF type:complete len:420 (-),score=85.29 TRINITY_DN8384_c0_g1_i1:473-1732(-)